MFALNLDFKNFGTVTLAIAIRATQIHIAQKLHFHMLKAGTAAGRATAIATIETEFGCGVTALPRHRGVGENFADRVPGTDITHRVGTRGFANRRLIDKHHITQMVSTQQTVVCASAFGAFAEMTQQGRREYVLYQRGFARAADPGDRDPALQRKLDVQVAQIVFACAFQNQTRRGIADQTLQTHTDLFACAQIGTSQGVGIFQIGRCAVKHHLAAALTRARAHVDNPVRGQHHRRVVFHHHQGVTCVTQAQHGLCDAVHVTRVQTNAGLVQHKQGIDQRCAQCRGQVDALHLAAAQGAALPVQAQIADANIAQVFQARADFIQQQMQRLLLGLCVRSQ